MYWNDGSLGWGGWIVMVLSMAAFWGLLFWAAIAVIRAAPRSDAARSDVAASPEDLLAARFARGDIDEDEYRSRSDAIRRERSKAA